ncbi:hypothetical protein [Natribacillus halophilus]|uniref:Uncharacterized protein n=1 Tax=Natribacillus halophilus TaxID=549003 RepID=A0A1G8QIT7_9BACI|nr:hypothetical protein [Natribacillus halophilus]SDJ04503.1 hypothetical protein SAMN04488123_11257 [Natribacillus halophilus]
MKRNHRQEDIERHLRDLDGVRDTRAKEEIYRNIELKMQEKEQPVRRFRKPVVWGLSTAAGLVLTVIVVSQLPSPTSTEPFSADQPMKQDEEDLTGDDAEEETEGRDEVIIEEDDDGKGMEQEEEDEGPEEDESFDVTEEEAEPEEEDSTEEDEAADRRVEEMEEVHADINYRSAATENEDSLLALPFLAPDNETIVTITVDDSAEAENDAEDILSRVEPDEFGLHDSPLDDLNGDESPDESILAGLEEAARFDIDRQWPADWDEQLENGETETSAGYYLLPVDGNAYLVTGNSLDIEDDGDETLEDILQKMETEDDERFQSVVPPEVELENVDAVNDENVLLSYSGLDEMDENNETEWLVFIEGVLLTAADYGYDDIEFEGDIEDVEEIGPYQLNEAITPPVAPNYIGEVEN